MMDPITKYLLNEGRLLSDKTLYADIGKFKDKKNRLLFIVGVSGSGKSTLSRKLSKIFKVKYYELDQLWKVVAKKYKWDSGDNPYLSFFDEAKKLINSTKGRAIIEGIDICLLWDKFLKKKYMMNSSFIVIGTSGMKGLWRAERRTAKDGFGEDWGEYFNMIDNWAKNAPYGSMGKYLSIGNKLKIIADDLQKTNKDIVLKKSLKKDEKI